MRFTTLRLDPHITLFVPQVALNVVWPEMFFGLRQPRMALLEIDFLYGALVASALVYQPVSRLASWLTAPHSLWAALAALFNFKNRPLKSGAA